MPAQMDAAHPAGLVEMRVGPSSSSSPRCRSNLPRRRGSAAGWHITASRAAAWPFQVPPAAIRLRDVAAGRRCAANPTIVSACLSATTSAIPGAPTASTCSAGDERVDQGRRVARTRVRTVTPTMAPVSRRPHARRCAPDACGRPSSWRSSRPDRAAGSSPRIEPFFFGEPGQLGARRGREGTPRPAGSESVEPRPYPAAQCSASPHWLPASWHRCPPCAPPPAWRRPVLQHPGKHCLMGLEVNQATGADSVEWSGGASWPGASRNVRCSASRRRATRSLVPNPALQSSRATAVEIPARRDSADRPRPRRTTRTVPPRTRRTGRCVVEHSIQPLVKRVPSTLRQIRRHPHRRLPRSTAACPHRHARRVDTETDHVDPLARDFHHAVGT